MPFLVLALLAQVTPVQPIVKGTGLPLADSGEAQVITAIDAWFAALDAGDARALAGQVRQEGGGTTLAATAPDGTGSVRRQSWPQFLAAVGSGGGRQHERFTGQPAVEVDGDIAMVWGDVARSTGGRMTSCGVDHFDLVRENGRWQVQSLTASQRTTGCEAG